MTPTDLTRIEQALTDEVLETAYRQAEWLTMTRYCELADWRVMRQQRAGIMREVLLEAIRRALPAEEARTCATCRWWDAKDDVMGDAPLNTGFCTAVDRTAHRHIAAVWWTKAPGRARILTASTHACDLYARIQEPERP